MTRSHLSMLSETASRLRKQELRRSGVVHLAILWAPSTGDDRRQVTWTSRGDRGTVFLLIDGKNRNRLFLEDALRRQVDLGEVDRSPTSPSGIPNVSGCPYYDGARRRGRV